jgi:hypothetical protein
MDRASLDPKALFAQKPERPALHRSWRGAASGCGSRNLDRFTDRDGARLFPIFATNSSMISFAPSLEPSWV